MLAITVVDVVHGTAARHFYASKESAKLSLSEIGYQAFYQLDPDLVELKRGARPEIFQIVRGRTNQGLLTWIGLYTALPANLHAVRPRPGNYCGAGAWFLGSGFDSIRVATLLRDALTGLCAMIEQDAHPSRWDINKVMLDDLRLKSIGEHDAYSRDVDSGSLLGSKSVFIDAAKSDAPTIAAFLDTIQEDESFDLYRKILISDDVGVVDSVRDKGRIDFWTPQSGPKIDRPGQISPPKGKPLITSQRLTRRPSHVGWQANENDFDRIDRRIDIVESQIGKLSKANPAQFTSAVDRPHFVLLWNVMLSFGVLACCLQLFAPSFMGSSVSPPSSGLSLQDLPAQPSLRPGETQGLADRGLGEPKTADSHPKIDDCAGRTDCPTPAIAPLSNAADAQTIDQTALSVLTAIQKIQPVLDRFASKQSVKYKESFARMRAETAAIRDLVTKENAQRDNGARGKP